MGGSAGDSAGGFGGVEGREGLKRIVSVTYACCYGNTPMDFR